MAQIPEATYWPAIFILSPLLTPDWPLGLLHWPHGIGSASGVGLAG